MTNAVDPAVRASLIRPNSSVAAYAMAGALSKELLHDAKGFSSDVRFSTMDRIDQLCIESNRDPSLARQAIAEWIALPRHYDGDPLEEFLSGIYYGEKYEDLGFVRHVAKAINRFDTSLAVWVSTSLAAKAVAHVKCPISTGFDNAMRLAKRMRDTCSSWQRLIFSGAWPNDRKPAPQKRGRDEEAVLGKLEDVGLELYRVMWPTAYSEYYSSEFCGASYSCAQSWLASASYWPDRPSERFPFRSTMGFGNPVSLAAAMMAMLYNRCEANIWAVAGQYTSEEDRERLGKFHWRTRGAIESDLRDAAIEAVMSYPVQA